MMSSDNPDVVSFLGLAFKAMTHRDELYYPVLVDQCLVKVLRPPAAHILTIIISYYIYYF